MGDSEEPEDLWLYTSVFPILQSTQPARNAGMPIATIMSPDPIICRRGGGT